MTTALKAEALWREAYSKERARDYANLLRTGLGPLYQTVLDAVCEALRLLTAREDLRILDLGAGTGNLAGAILKEFPSASILCLDGSAAMLDVARKRFGSERRVSFIERDFGASDWVEDIGPFDAVVSTGAVHHLDDRGKEGLFRQVFGLLGSGGVFLCADQLRGESERLGRINEDAWVRVIGRNLAAQGQEHPLEFIREQHRMISSAEGDQPSRLSEQLEWMNGAGFSDVEVLWKYFAFALFGGARPQVRCGEN